MSFLKRLFSPKEKTTNITDHNSFWNWFLQHEKAFYQVVKTNNDVDGNFLNKLMPPLQQLNNQFYCLTGMYDDNTVELVLTAEGYIKTFVFVEELVAAAPAIAGWKFTALKPPLDANQWSIEMDGYKFNNEKIRFYSDIQEDYPDEIDIMLVHSDYNEADKKVLTNGSLIYLDNKLGELNAATLIDSIAVSGACPAGVELISMDKLGAFLLWREKEFVEKYKGRRYDTANDEYAIGEARDAKGLPWLGVVNKKLLHWDAKASHPWMLVIEINYTNDGGGMPDKPTYALLDEFEDELTTLLPDAEGYLNLGRETYNNTRTIYFACHEFRYSSKTVDTLINNYKDRMPVTYDIYKDKYWKTMNRFTQ